MLILIIAVVDKNNIIAVVLEIFLFALHFMHKLESWFHSQTIIL